MVPPIATSDITDANSAPISEPQYAPNSSYTIPEVDYGSKRKMRIGFIGAGVSGMNFFKFAEDPEKLSDVDIVCWEKNSDVGGTWLENRYAGCACDIPSVNYQYRWRPHVWSKYYSPGPEIWDYLKLVERENRFIDKYIKLRHAVISAEWEDKNAYWLVKVKNLETGEVKEEKVDMLLNGGGVLNTWKWPTTPGFRSFKGRIMHSARWDPDYDFTDKRVAVIGAGSSAVQIIPTIYPKLAKLYTWVRSPVWITAGFAQDFAGKDGRNYQYTSEQKKYMQDHPDEYLAYRKLIEGEINKRFSLIVQGTQAATEAREFSTAEMTKKLSHRPELLDAIIPKDFGVGCRRPTPGTEGYLEALSGEKTTPYHSTLGQITEKGFIDEKGEEVEVDIIVCATGFDTSFAPSFALTVNGESVNEKLFSDSSKTLSYLSLALPEVPNYLTFCGAFGAVAHGSFFPLIEQYTNYANEMITKMQVERIRSVRPKLSQCIQFRAHAEEFLKRTAWTGPCSSWFKNGKKDGVPLLYPGSRCHFLKLVEHVRWEDFDVEWDAEQAGNMWAFLGNGFNAIERVEEEDNNWYLGKPEKEVDMEAVKKMMQSVPGTEWGFYDR